MTGEEEAVLKEYLLHHGEIEDDGDLESWYIKRFEAQNQSPLQAHLAPSPSVEGKI